MSVGGPESASAPGAGAPDAASLRAMSVEAFAAALAARRPVPGGGAASALALAHAAALAEMVIQYSLGKASLEAHQPFLEQARTTLESSRRRAIELMELDAARYALLNAAFARPRQDPDRAESVRRAAIGAAEPPMEALDAAGALLGLTADLVRRTARSLRSDLGVAGALGLAAADGAAWNIRANLPLTGDDRPALERRSGASLARAREASARLVSELESIAAEGAA